MSLRQKCEINDTEVAGHAISKVISTTRNAWLAGDSDVTPDTAQAALGEPRRVNASRRARGGRFYVFPASFAP